MAKNAKKNNNRSKFFLFKQPKIIIIVAFVALFAGIGVKQLKFGQAAVAIPATYFTTNSAIGHQTGNFVYSVPEILAGSRVYINVRRWPATLTSIDSYQKTHFLQYGPYATITIPGDKTGLYVCYFYSTWNVLGYSGYVKMYTDLFDSDNVNFYTGKAEPEYYVYQKITEDRRDQYNQPIIRKHCYNYQFHFLQYGNNGPTTLHNVEFRLKAYDASDQFGVVDLWKTTVNFY